MNEVVAVDSTVEHIAGGPDDRMAGWGTFLPLRIRRWQSLGSVAAVSDDRQPDRDGASDAATNGDADTTAHDPAEAEPDTAAVLFRETDATTGDLLQPEISNAGRGANPRGDAITAVLLDGDSAGVSERSAVELHMGRELK